MLNHRLFATSLEKDAMTQVNIAIRALYDEDHTGPLSGVVGTTGGTPFASQLSHHSGPVDIQNWNLASFCVIRLLNLQRCANSANSLSSYRHHVVCLRGLQKSKEHLWGRQEESGRFLDS